MIGHAGHSGFSQQRGNRYTSRKVSWFVYLQKREPPFVPDTMKNKIIIFAFLTISLFATTSTAQTNEAETKRRLIGVWQDSKGVGSGLTNNYQFFENGTFRFNYNEMDGIKRLLSYSGIWNVYKSRLYVHINRMTFHIGGRWKAATGSIATEYEIVGGRAITKKISPIERLSYSLSAIELEEEMYTTVRIGDTKFWKLSSDPEAYEN